MKKDFYGRVITKEQIELKKKLMQNFNWDKWRANKNKSLDLDLDDPFMMTDEEWERLPKHE